MEAEPLNKTAYEWLWTVRSVRSNEGEKVPMEKGDLLYICLCDDNAVRFHHRAAGAAVNGGPWQQAKGRYDSVRNSISGSLPDGTTFEMLVAREGKYHRITCTHKRNPEQGSWDADDETGH